MTTTDTDYNGPERRKDWQKLDDAIREVARLHGTTEILANAVTNTAPKHELEALREEMKREHNIRIYISASLTGLAVILLVIFVSVKINNLNKSVKHGHSVITCMQGKTEVQRTAEAFGSALVTCEQTAR